MSSTNDYTWMLSNLALSSDLRRTSQSRWSSRYPHLLFQDSHSDTGRDGIGPQCQNRCEKLDYPDILYYFLTAT